MSKALSSTENSEVTDQVAKRITRVEELTYDLKIGDAMSREVSKVTPDMPMSYVLDILRTKHISGLPVIENDELIGVISLEDLIRSMTASDLDAPIKKYMTSNPITIKAYDRLIEAAETFNKLSIGRLPVVDENNKLVGIITKGDITRGVLIALQKDIQVEEVRRYRASHLFEDICSDRTSLILRYDIKKGDITHGGNASSNIKRALVRLGANPQIARRCGIAIYEAEINLIIHTTNGGIIKVEIEPHRITMKAIDEGPGIPDTNLALQAGYSTATEETRALGFGAGMGLPNIQRCVDRLTLVSEVGKGTRLDMYIYLQPEDSFRGSLNPPEEKTVS